MLIFSSEEQLKVFSLPKIAAKRKFKLTAIDGSLVRRVAFGYFASPNNPDHHEIGLTCLTNLGKTDDDNGTITTTSVVRMSWCFVC